MDLDWIWKAVLIIGAGIMLLRTAGRRSISQMTISQTVIMISIGTLLIQPVSGKNIWVTIATAALLILTLLFLEYIQIKWDAAETFLTGRAKIVIENGVVHQQNLKKLKLSIDKLEMRLRQSGIENISDVRWATMEPSGQIGYALAEKKKPATKEDIDQLMRTVQSIAMQLNIPLPPSPPPPDQRSSATNLFSEVQQNRNIPEPPTYLQ
jgi:uncharacterized membrane protein YcaP (DUF421 family)